MNLPVDKSRPIFLKCQFGIIGSHFVLYAKEFSFDLVFEPDREEGTMCSLL